MYLRPKEITITMDVVGCIIVEKLDPQPNQIIEFEWVGQDYIGTNVHPKEKSCFKS